MIPLSVLSCAHTSKKATGPRLVRRGDGSVGDLDDEQHASQPADVMETAKLVATCTAAATAALLASADTERTSKVSTVNHNTLNPLLHCQVK